MRWFGWIVTLAALAFAGQTGFALWQSVQAGPERIALVQPRTGQAKPVPEPQKPTQINWPPVFGEAQPPKPAPPPAPIQPEPEPPRPPKPPIDTLGYSLKGLVQTGKLTWAMVYHPTGEQLVRVGDKLDIDIEVSKIDDAGVWVSRSGDKPELLDFSE